MIAKNSPIPAPIPSFKLFGIELINQARKGVNEIGKRFDTGEVVIKIDPRYFRPSEVEHLLGDPKKALEKLGWRPSSTLEELIHEMIDFDKNEANREFLLKQKGFNVFGAMETPPNLNNNK